MVTRKGVFIGAYVPAELKRTLQTQARSEHRTLSQEITRILEIHVKGRGAQNSQPERRDSDSAPRRRASDPTERRRSSDAPLPESLAEMLAQDGAQDGADGQPTEAGLLAVVGAEAGQHERPQR